MTEKEIDTTKGISNETVCNYFYVVFIMISILAGISLASDIALTIRRPSVGWVFLLRTVVVFSIAVANSLFLYIMCARTLLK